jgi:hypothetical protein
MGQVTSVPPQGMAVVSAGEHSAPSFWKQPRARFLFASQRVSLLPHANCFFLCVCFLYVPLCRSIFSIFNAVIFFPQLS